MSFTALHIECSDEQRDLLMAELSMLSFDTFEENDLGISAFCDAAAYPIDQVKEIIDRYSSSGAINIRTEQIERVNWNKEWEKSYDPVFVDDQVVVKAIFHDLEKSYPYEITIHPKMSFGTGHHATTALMLRTQMKLDHRGKKVYDFGSGTGVLAIMAHKLGATDILATDVDEWCIENSQENFGLNDLTAPTLLGKIQELDLTKSADIILANINKNVLLEEMSAYMSLLKEGGYILISGFYEKDIPDLTSPMTKLGGDLVLKDNKDGWAVLLFKKTALS